MLDNNGVAMIYADEQGGKPAVLLVITVSVISKGDLRQSND